MNSFRADIKYGVVKEFKVKCNCCGCEIKVNEREKLFPKKEKYLCSRSCANKREHSEETKNKISKSLKKTKWVPPILENCSQCKNEFVKKYKSQTFCSVSCATSWKNINLGMSRIGGLASAKTQSENRRSKNEIYFAELCQKQFKNVLTNEAIFNGWDADVIIEDIRIAVLWNGRWHYDKLTESHSVKQVQNRDKIKVKEIKKAGYTPYIIKDMGKSNNNLVEKEFSKFICFLKQNNYLCV